MPPRTSRNISRRSAYAGNKTGSSKAIKYQENPIANRDRPHFLPSPLEAYPQFGGTNYFRQNTIHIQNTDVRAYLLFETTRHAGCFAKKTPRVSTGHSFTRVVWEHSPCDSGTTNASVYTLCDFPFPTERNILELRAPAPTSRTPRAHHPV